ncbi:type I restriction enzyme HsdR N-terminal domain-containing protein [Thalassolituus sp. ST750PaO-4]|uniref:type I restriction endonuclease n=1 Tax=Thalassolituus sp. ST750PaO-4 TaxID=2742965 RepID=UPI001CE28A11|nr:type I restriction endonuclease [Thalassolituus sp. ST750PaO-4]MCA6058568.1 type I restriction enzyme HsdR N-terminal domain-containing protein [Thalassolituus sp. ST750PaO-4]
MDLIDRIADLAKRIDSMGPNLQTEEATKNALIMPFIQNLGYDVFDPSEVVPEYTTDHGVKKGEKVDYAVKKDDEIIMLFECKKYGAKLVAEHASQLYRYFSVSDARFGVLTNGQQYMFFTDLDRPNQMDEKPFFSIDLQNFERHEVEELKKFTKNSFDLENILNTASDLKYTTEVKKILGKELDDPSDDFVRFLSAQVYSGRFTQAVMEQFRGIVKRANRQLITEKINDRLETALAHPLSEDKEILHTDVNPDEAQGDNGIVTTEEEIEAYNIVKAILRSKVEVGRIVMRDTKSYCGVLLDDNNRKPICRFHFNSKQKYLGLMKEKIESREPIDSLDEIFKYSDQLVATVEEY